MTTFNTQAIEDFYTELENKNTILNTKIIFVQNIGINLVNIGGLKILVLVANLNLGKIVLIKKNNGCK